MKKITIKGAFKLFLAAALAWLAGLLVFLPSGSEFKQVAPKRSAVMLEQELKSISYRFVPLEQISPALRLAVLVAEDMDFVGHSGFAWGELYHSITDAILKFQKPRGASTITQQLAKNLYLSNARSPFRKIKEAIITLKMEGVLSKRRIFELYLNIVELGPGVFGVEAGAQHWFAKSANNLTASEAAKLAAILPGPNGALNPKRYAKRVSFRQQLLLGRMAKARLPAGL